MSQAALSQKERMLGWVILAPLLFGLFVEEWNYSRVAFFTIPLYLSYPSELLSVCAPISGLLLIRGQFSQAARRAFGRNVLLYFIFFLVFLIQLFVYPEAEATYDRRFLLTLVSVPLWGMTGFLFAPKIAPAQWLLEKFALFAAVGSFFSFSLNLAGVPMMIPFGVASWPVRLFFLFGFCWYMGRYLSTDVTNGGSLAGLACCSLEVLLTLHKPIIWASGFSVLILLLVLGKTLPKRKIRKSMLRMVKVAVATGLFLVVMNVFLKGALVEEIKLFVYDRVLKSSVTEEAITMERISGSRISMWTAALEVFGKSPWVGSGIMDLDYYGGKVSMHNGYLDLLFIGGICGFIPVAYGVWYWLTRVVRSIAYVPIMPVQASCLAYFVGILMYNLGGTSRLFVNVTAFTALVLGITLRLAVDCRTLVHAAPIRVVSHTNLASI